MADFFNRVFSTPQGQERRRFRRLKSNCPVDYRFFNGERYQQSVTCDISEGGISFLVDGPVETGTHIYFEAKLRNRPQSLYGIARVAWSSPEPYSEKYKVGLEFVEAGSISKADISSFIEQHQVACFNS
ncbi:MAG: PilZ domain-containing protein [Candidatus Omnitrophota bacterium]